MTYRKRFSLRLASLLLPPWGQPSIEPPQVGAQCRRKYFRPPKNRAAGGFRRNKLVIRLQLSLLFLFAASVCLGDASAYGQVDKAYNLQSDGQGAPIQPLPPNTSNNGQLAESVSVSPVQRAESSTQSEPDTHLLSSGELLGLGSLNGLRRVFDPSFEFSQSGQTGMLLGRVLAVSSLGGSVDVAKNWRRYNVSIVYRGAETIYQPSYVGLRYLPYHRLGISQEILLDRWTLRLRDELRYSWAAGFGGIFTGGPSQTGQSALLNGIQPTLVPNDTIQTGLARQLGDTVIAEADYAFSRRTTMTFMGSYNLLHFFSPGYIGSHDIHERVGYNYALSAKNNVSLSYDHDRMSFDETNSRLQTDTAQIGFGRKVTGRLAFQVAVGPELLYLYNLGPSNRRQLSWSAFSGMAYNLRHNNYSFSYSHAASGGSGVFVGTETNTFTMVATHGFKRFWSLSLNGGYARNRNLAPVPSLANQFQNWYVGSGLNRPIGRQVQFGLNYEYSEQISGGGGCPVLSCGFPGSISQFGVTLRWHPVATIR